MKKDIITNVQYEDTGHKAALDGIRDKLIATAELQGKHDGMQNKPKMPLEHRAHILNHIEVTLQGAIDLNQQKYLPISGIAVAKLIETEANKKEQEFRNTIHDEEHKLHAAKKELEQNKPDVKLIVIRKVVFAALVFIALAEGWLSYPAFRHTAFPVIAAMIASAAIAFTVGIAAHHLGGYIKKAKDRKQMIRRYVISLAPAIIGFSALGIMRANAYNHHISIQAGTEFVTQQRASSASAPTIAIVSILLYWGALFLSSRFFRTKEERMQEQTYEEKCKTLADLQTSIRNKENEITQVRYEKVSGMALAVKMYEYAVYEEKSLVNFAQEAAEAYKQSNMRHRTDGTPIFFSEKPVFHFNLFFNTIKSTRNEAA